jgi:Ca-activated chloride channel family protein
VTALYAREHVADLEMRWTIGREVEMIDRTIERIGVAFQIATRKTSWLAIDEKRSVDPALPSRREEMPHELPYGTSLASFGLAGPQTRSGMARPMLMALQAMPSMASISGGPTGYGAPAGGAPPAPRENGLMSASSSTQARAPVGMRRKIASRWALFFVLLLVFFLVALAISFFTR